MVEFNFIGGAAPLSSHQSRFCIPDCLLLLLSVFLCSLLQLAGLFILILQALCYLDLIPIILLIRSSPLSCFNLLPVSVSLFPISSPFRVCSDSAPTVLATISELCVSLPLGFIWERCLHLC